MVVVASHVWVYLCVHRFVAALCVWCRQQQKVEVDRTSVGCCWRSCNWEAVYSRRAGAGVLSTGMLCHLCIYILMSVLQFLIVLVEWTKNIRPIKVRERRRSCVSNCILDLKPACGRSAGIAATVFVLLIPRIHRKMNVRCIFAVCVK